MPRSLPAPTPLAKLGAKFRQAWRKLHPHSKGRAAEAIALLALLTKGYRPAPRPLRALAQTDLLLLKGQTLVLIEVKARTTQERAHLALTPQQKQRLARQAQALAARYPHLSTRLDVVLLYPHPPFLSHIRGVDLA